MMTETNQNDDDDKTNPYVLISKIETREGFTVHPQRKKGTSFYIILLVKTTEAKRVWTGTYVSINQNLQEPDRF